MQIKRTSWHYRFMEATGCKPAWRQNLCEYMRGFVKACAIAFGMSVMAIVLVSAAIVVLFVMLYTLLGGWLGEETYTAPLWWVGLLFWAALETYGAIYVIRRVNSRRTKKPREDGPFKQWISDRHKNICRMVEFIN